MYSKLHDRRIINIYLKAKDILYYLRSYKLTCVKVFNTFVNILTVIKSINYSNVNYIRSFIDIFIDILKATNTVYNFNINVGVKKTIK